MIGVSRRACAHVAGAECWLCSDARPWCRAARIKAGLGEEPPNRRRQPRSPKCLITRVVLSGNKERRCAHCWIWMYGSTAWLVAIPRHDGNGYAHRYYCIDCLPEKYR